MLRHLVYRTLLCAMLDINRHEDEEEHGTTEGVEVQWIREACYAIRSINSDTIIIISRIARRARLVPEQQTWERTTTRR